MSLVVTVEAAVLGLLIATGPASELATLATAARLLPSCVSCRVIVLLYFLV